MPLASSLMGGMVSVQILVGDVRAKLAELADETNRLGRNAILIELNPDYAEMARSRIERGAGLFASVA